MNRYYKFLLWLGTSQLTVPDMKANEFCRILSEFALEYRTTRERAQFSKSVPQKYNTLPMKQSNESNTTSTMKKSEILSFTATREDRKDAELR